MEIQLYVYDLTNGMARQLSQAYLGIQIDAVYHTSLVFGGIEYFFGAGVQTCRAGSTHHGRPMEIIPMGSTQLPIEVILDYLESLKEVYTPESYDLFAHNCNNFTNDFSMFLLGKGIPEHITSLPKRVLDTPFGQMLRPQIEAGMRGTVQRPLDEQNALPSTAARNGTAHGAEGSAQRTAISTNGNGMTDNRTYGRVIGAKSLAELERHLQGAKETATTIFFTSSTCAPCKIAYPMFDTLADRYSNALFVKVDLNVAQDVGAKYQVRATPTFMTFSKGVKQDEWSGADPNMLKGNVERLINTVFPPHPHTSLKLPTLQYGSLKPVTYSKIPPLDKLMTKLGNAGQDPQLTTLKSFIETRNKDAREAPLPNLHAISQTFRSKVLSLPVDVRFAAVDLIRCATIDPRISGYFAEEQAPALIPTLLKHINDLPTCPHNLRLVTIQLACNMFTSPLFVRELTQGDTDLLQELIQLVTRSLLDISHPSVRVSSAWLAFNLATMNYRVRREEEQEALAEAEQVELAASIVETLGSETNEEAVKALLLSLGFLLYCGPANGEVMDLCRALDVKKTARECAKMKGLTDLAGEVGSLL
ncbi:hypothetical protein LTR86_003468 [Recurvomyces mirabilis]|nr:hypothetical protein LTR86_003468 [Recurvomyces mirabilis]